MKSSVRISLILLVFALLAAACASQPAVSHADLRPALPTASVPPLQDVDAAIQRWQDSGNQRYYLKVEEKTTQGLRRLHIVVDQGEVRAALVQTRTADGWSDLSSLPFAEAEKYTVEGLFARIRRDTLGAGPAPVNLKVAFDKDIGIPLVASAEGLPSYTADGQVRLNREFGYTITAEIAALLEETAGNDSGVWLELTQGNGPQAWCDHLYIFQDGASFYTDDCRQVALPLQLPAARVEELQALSAQFSTLEAEQSDKEQVRRLSIQGSGTQPADESTIQAAWNLADQLYELLSYPLGAGVSLIFTQDEQVLGAEMLSHKVQPARLSVYPPLHGARVSLDGQYLALSDDHGLRALAPSTGKTYTLLIAPQDESYYLPLAWNLRGQLAVAQHYPDGRVRLGWVSIEENTWHDLPLPEGLTSYRCPAGLAWSPDGSLLSIAGRGETDSCRGFAGLVVVDLQAGTASRMPDIPAAAHPAWSPDGEWLAFSMPDGDTWRVFVVHPDGSGLAPVSANAIGVADWPVWSPDGLLFYAQQQVSSEENGLFRYDLNSGETTTLLQGEHIQPLDISPDGEFLLYRSGDLQKVWSFLREEDMQVVLKADADPAGWLMPPEQP